MYIRFTSPYGSTFQEEKAGGVRFDGYVDSDYASNATDRRSVAGGVVVCEGSLLYFSVGLRRVSRCPL